MEYTEFYFPSNSNLTKIHVNQWIPNNRKPRAVIQIAHGVAEYGRRYQHLAEFLCANGFAVVANDHLGHGLSQIPYYPPVYFGAENGWWNVVKDMETLRQEIGRRFPGIPVFLLGHSMGSFLTRTHMILYPGFYDGYIICGTGHPSDASIHAGQKLSQKLIKKKGTAGHSHMMENLAFGNYNRKFAPNRTDCDWISYSATNVDNYIDDPLCGGKTSLGLFRDMFEGLSFITDKKNIAKMNINSPVFFIAGNSDPVGDMGKGVQKAYQLFMDAGVCDVRMKLYPGLRHEILNEDSRLDVYQDILSWLENRITDR